MSSDTILRDEGATPELSGMAAPIRSLSKGLAALDILRREGELRTTDLAGLLSIDKAIASRILQTLALAGYAERVQGRRYRVGPRLDPAGEAGAHQGGIKVSARPLLEALAGETGESTYLGVLVDDQVLYLDKVVPANTLIVDRPIPTLTSRCCNAIGKLFTAICELPVPKSLPAFTNRTITDPVRYRAEIRKIADKGYSWDDEELNLGVRCVAAPLRNAQGAMVAALCLAAPTARMAASEIDTFGRLTLAVAETFALA